MLSQSYILLLLGVPIISTVHVEILQLTITLAYTTAGKKIKIPLMDQSYCQPLPNYAMPPKVRFYIVCNHTARDVLSQ